MAALLDDDNDQLSAFLASTTDFGGGTKPTKGGYQRPKEELEYLKRKHDALTQQLHALHAQQALVPVSSRWALRAVEQTQLAQRSLLENKRLKEMVEGQLQMITSLQKMLLKHPALTTFRPSTGLCILGIEHRRQEVDALMAYHLERLESEWIRHRLYEALDDDTPLNQLTVLEPATTPEIRLSYVGSQRMPLDFRTMGDVLWDHKLGDHHPVSEILERFNDNLVYVREENALHDSDAPVLESRSIVQRIQQDQRVVMLWRSILEDRLYPHGPNRLIANRMGWVVVHPRSHNECVLQTVVVMSTPIASSLMVQPAVGTLTELVLHTSEANRRKFGVGLHNAVAARVATRQGNLSPYSEPPAIKRPRR
ncbi:hypothetical protein SPRG_09540 [Saprolegnia parasitica CBS 223.65]|uniref:START domain-containing protein n=1 Tax=Saprolegnia parasitica (strain CBS 223.65) TaxID=695850 RepID=A0A067CEC1_SAPPC|nr:hypothetical protein SPRG_09540 [Saprolegnia parasitica CBS 223.65]KDO24896.1 hypothetical protein SPRG_09540 [Saprolegnia parasitica CBS 223.65]|eukprot:XP_012204356.1 hypothetical protein SPRG_09540 [Saprolegnia parasitica CBS 223.65]